MSRAVFCEITCTTSQSIKHQLEEAKQAGFIDDVVENAGVSCVQIPFGERDKVKSFLIF